jgi:tRNA uracil 4-sulfurtransferase
MSPKAKQTKMDDAVSTPVILIHYGEIALKRGNRGRFEERLMTNIRTALASRRKFKIRKMPGRLVVELSNDDDLDDIMSRIQKVFGIANIALARRIKPDIDLIRAEAIRLASEVDFKSFAIRTKRGEKQFPMSSQEINVDVGAAVAVASGAKVDLTNPEFTIGIELLNRHAFVFADRIPGRGGLPAGASGLAAFMISGGIDSPVASYRILKRGCEALYIHFHSAPFTSADSQDKAEEIVEHLMECQPACKLIMVPFGVVQKKIVTAVPQEYRVVLYRRFMVRIACKLAERHRAHALITGEALAQVASQTTQNLGAIDAVSTLPILRPLIGMDKGEIVDEARVIGTYDLSIQPHDDCCSFLTPRHPVTKSTAQELDDVEGELDVDALVAMSLADIKEIQIKG